MSACRSILDFLVMSFINMRRPKPDVQWFSFRSFHSVDPEYFAANLQMTDAAMSIYVSPANDVEIFCNQIQSSVTASYVKRSFKDTHFDI